MKINSGLYLKIKYHIRINLRKFYFYHYKGSEKYDLLIFDDAFPHPVSGFRLEEFTVLLKEFKNSKIIVNSDSYPIFKTPIEEHQTHINNLLVANPEFKNKLKVRKRFSNINSKLFYCVFINNIYNNISWLERFKIPFAFTLYPGGGFKINDKSCDRKLKRVLSSKMFRKVIVTQKFTKDYLLEKNFCKKEKIEFVFGSVVPQLSLIKDLNNRKNYLINKSTFDICFCAGKYMVQGKDKGYDVFVDLAISLVKKYDFIHFHVIGGFDELDIDVSMLKDKIKFYGYQKFENLESIFKNMDILISPNKPFVINSGAFDGFPLGTVVEAALNGVTVLITDELKQNTAFIDNEELIIIESNVSFIENAVINLINNPDKLRIISEKGRKKFMKIYSNEVQMKPKIDLLKQLIA